MLRVYLLIVCAAVLGLTTACSTLLISAAQDGDTKRVIALLDQGTDPNEVGGSGATALQVAAVEGHLETVKALVDRGADMEKRPAVLGASMGTPLYLAAYLGHTQIVQFLLSRGADTGMRNDLGQTALDVARERGYPRIVQLLEQAEARVLAKEQSPSPLAPSTTQMPSPKLTSDVDRLPAATGRLNKHAYAVVIGIEQYRERLPKADFADRDATLMGEYLTKVLGYPEENVVVRVNEKAAKADLEKYFEEWLPNNVDPGGSVFIYYSGHGAPNAKTGDAYLVPYDGDPNFVGTTAYPLKRLYASLGKLPAKDITVVLDSCFSGAGGRSVLAKGARPMVLSVENAILASGKTVVITASSGSQTSSTYEEKSHGLFTYYFLKGLQGEGDLNHDGAIDMAELYEYVKPNVQRVARKQYNTEQTPQLLANPDVLHKGGGWLIEPQRP